MPPYKGRIGTGEAPLEARNRRADRENVRVRLRSEAGFGLIELLMAMVMLNIGILAIVAAFNSGMFALKRAGQLSTAGALADSQMEQYRAVTYSAIALDSTALGTVDNTYKCDSALGAGCPNSTTGEVTTTCSGSPIPAVCNPSSSVTGADHKPYRVDTYITTTTPSGGRPLKVVTVVVRDGNQLSARPLARISSTFDQSTG
jgi:type II secretory pathway pseudopilin PulG